MEDFKEYKNYRIYKNGDIVSAGNKLISAYDLTHKKSHVNLYINGKIERKNKAVLIYNTFSDAPIDTKTHVIRFIDGNEENCSFDNLECVPRGEILKQYSNKPKFSDEQKQQIIDDYRAGASLRKLSLKNDCALLTIQKILSEQSKEKKNGKED